MADYFCTFCGCRHEPLDHLPPKLAAAIERNNAKRGRPLTAREKLDNLAAWLGNTRNSSNNGEPE